MSAANPEPQKVLLPEELFAQAVLLLDKAIHFAFRRHHHLPTPDDAQSMKGRLEFYLWKDNYHRLRTYDQRAQLVTWLQTMTNHDVGDFLREKGQQTSIKDAPPELFIQPPTQEEELLRKERGVLLEKVLRTLTAREQKLFALLCQGRKAKEIMQELGGSLASARTKSSVLRKKVRRLFKEAEEQK